MATPILGAGDLLPQLYRAERRVQEFAELLLAEDMAMVAVLAAYGVPEGAQDVHHRQTEQRQLALAAIRLRLAAIRATASRVLP